MFFRLLFILLSGTIASGSDFIDNWPPGKTEKLTYEIHTSQPSETKSYVQREITRLKEKESTFVVRQTLEMPEQAITIISTEEYSGKNLQLVSSENYFKLPPQAKEKFGTDSVVIRAEPVKDSLGISSNSKLVPSCKIPYPDNLITSAGSILVMRKMDFKIGASAEYKFVNLLKITDSKPVIIEVKDSVLSIERISTPAGTFDCYKVKTTVPGAASYSYFTTDKKHIPVKTELIDPASGEITMTLTLQKYE